MQRQFPRVRLVSNDSTGKRVAQAAAAVSALGLGALSAWDMTQKKHSILRNYPIAGHARFLLESIRPEIQQYFIERNWDGRPFSRDTRTTIYERAKGKHSEHAFGTEHDVNRTGYEALMHSAVPITNSPTPPRVRIGGKDCTQPYDISLLNVSAMSFGSLSNNAVRALNKGAAMGGFAHDTGEGSISPYHQEFGGDLIWELGTGYFGSRRPDGEFDPEVFARKSQDPQVKMVSLKLSQGAKPGIGGVLPGPKVTEEIAEIRGIPVGKTCVSPPNHRVFSTPIELLQFIAKMRELSGGKPAGFKLCVGSRTEFLAICKAMVETGITPDFIIVDGSEGGTGAAPLEFEDHVGLPLTQGLMIVHNALMGAGLRDQIKVGASGKIASGSDIVKRLIQGADFTNSARAMMMAVGCIQAQVCHTGKCPVGVATQDPRRARAIDVPDKSTRVKNYHASTVAEAVRLMASMGATHPDELEPTMLRRNVSASESWSYARLYDWLKPGKLLDGAPDDWADDWETAQADSFAIPHGHSR
ncbi:MULTISPECIES: FMN-binding glutamate synthase family protein [Brevibacterium]|uniref:Glutamate synthase domain-containing protein 2 n=1 Tax=Brevibacterium antiquum CNRZ 918 TaxID=1255637 RepID=A0A2H1KMP5_9MICO|nr:MULTISPECIES: FMN-binding glutamate synthase family protein [Brevibacterium]SMY00492.1 Glutamate synthase domain-containing protein 2 [Brevibacterium antiquum CNRZ 918]HCG55923.1 FMN-binding glutamate synthase family protein [Brevibacterium sp.]